MSRGDATLESAGGTNVVGSDDYQEGGLGGSVMASASCVYPSITYLALTARAADCAVDQVKQRNL
jgi:hypothetical protein